MAIDDSGNWWVGSEARDIDTYLRAYTHSESAYPMTAFRLVYCNCGSDRFKVERAVGVSRRQCASCGAQGYPCRGVEDWEEAVEEETPEAYSCVDCQCDEANLGVGFAGYGEAIDAVKWFYLGVRCAECGVLGCFADGKVGWGPASEVYNQV